MNIVQEKNIMETAAYLRDKMPCGTYLVTGATGTIGEYIIRILLKLEKIKVIAVCHDLNKGFTLFKDCIDDNLVIIQADITKEVQTEFRHIDYVIHAAGICSNRTCKEYPQEVINVNVGGTYNILEYAKKKNVKKFLFFSSASVYGKLSSKTYRENEYGEIDFLNPQDAYGLSKRIGENLCVTYKKAIPIVVVRPFHIIAPNIMSDSSSMLGDFYGKIMSGNDIELNSNGMMERNFTWIGDMVGMILEIMFKKDGIYNVGNPHGTIAVKEMAEMMMEILGKTCDIKSKKNIRNKSLMKTSNLQNMVPNLEKISKQINCDKCMSIEDAVKICMKCNCI